MLASCPQKLGASLPPGCQQGNCVKTSERHRGGEELQWASESRGSFLSAFKQLQEKYNEKELDCVVKKALDEFFSYLSSTWINSSESAWFEGAHPYGASNNQVIEVNLQLFTHYYGYRELKASTNISRTLTPVGRGYPSGHSAT